MDELSDEDDVVGVGAEIVAQGVPGTVDHALAHALGGEDCCRVLDRLGQVEHSRAQRVVAPAQGD